jgi:hypothetical protein
MAHRTTCLFVATLAWLAGAQHLGAQARERVAYVTVVDRATGLPKDALSPSDIAVREDGVAREILRVSPATGPLPIAVLVDTSAAAEPSVPDLRAALTAFVAALGPVGPVALVGIGDRPTVRTDYTSLPAALTAGIGRVFARPQSGATVIEAIAESATGLNRKESERAAIVLLSVGGPEASSLHYLRALEQLKASGAALFSVMLRSRESALNDSIRQRDTLIDRGVHDTGGSRRDVISSQAFTPAMADVARILAHQFRVVYARPQTLIPPASIDVRAVSPGAIAYGGAARGPLK